jgi:hypothetical protein
VYPKADPLLSTYFIASIAIAFRPTSLETRHLSLNHPVLSHFPRRFSTRKDRIHWRKIISQLVWFFKSTEVILSAFSFAFVSAYTPKPSTRHGSTLIGYWRGVLLLLLLPTLPRHHRRSSPTPPVPSVLPGSPLGGSGPRCTRDGPWRKPTRSVTIVGTESEQKSIRGPTYVLHAPSRLMGG